MGVIEWSQTFGEVWNDGNRDGIITGTRFGVEKLTITLFKCNFRPFSTEATSRRDGAVGQPMKGVQARIRTVDNQLIAFGDGDVDGELEIKSESMFKSKSRSRSKSEPQSQYRSQSESRSQSQSCSQSLSRPAGSNVTTAVFRR